MSTTAPPTGITRAIVGDAEVIHAAEAVHYGPPDLETETDGECATPPRVGPAVQ